MTTPGAGEGERWGKQRMYGERDTVLWAILEKRGGVFGKVVGSALLEADADLICKLHNHPWVPDLLIDHDAPVCEICGEGMSAHTEESLLFREYMELHNAREADQQTITELTDAANWLTLQREELTIQLQDATRTIAELRKAVDLEALASAVHQAYLDTCAKLGWDVKPTNRVPYADLIEESKELDRASVRAVLSAIAATEEPSSHKHDWAEVYNVGGSPSSWECRTCLALTKERPIAATEEKA